MAGLFNKLNNNLFRLIMAGTSTNRLNRLGGTSKAMRKRTSAERKKAARALNREVGKFKRTLDSEFKKNLGLSGKPAARRRMWANRYRQKTNSKTGNTQRNAAIKRIRARKSTSNKEMAKVRNALRKENAKNKPVKTRGAVRVNRSKKGPRR